MSDPSRPEPRPAEPRPSQTAELLRELRALAPSEPGPGRSVAPSRPSAAAAASAGRGGAAAGRSGPGRRRRGTPERGSRRWGGRRLRVCGAVLLAAAVVTGARALAVPGPASGPAAAQRESAAAARGGDGAVDRAAGSVWPAATDWFSVVRGLDEARVRALRRRDGDGLRAVAVAGSRVLRADLRAVRALEAAGVRPAGLRSGLRDAELVRRPSATRAVLRVVDRRPAYRLVDGRGETVRTVPSAGERTWRVVLDRAAGRWQVAAVRPADVSPGRTRSSPAQAGS